MTKIDEKNNEMIKLKKMVGLVTQTLNYRKVSVQILVLSIHEQSKLKRFLVLN